MKALQVVAYACICLLGASQSDAALYGARSGGTTGELYTLNPATGAMLTDIGPLNDVTGLNYPITGLAFHPITGVLYGSTGNSAAGTAAKLVTIDPATGLVTPVGSFNAGPTNTGGTPATMADIEFDSAGNLYGVGSIGGPQLYSVNAATAQATVIGGTGLTSTTGGGIGIDPSGVIFGTPTATRFGTYNSVTGAFTIIANPAKPVGGGYAAIAFNGGVLYGLDLGTANAAELVTIDPATGAVTDLGPSVVSLDAIAFTVPEPGAAGLIAGAITLAAVARRRNRA